MSSENEVSENDQEIDAHTNTISEEKPADEKRVFKAPSPETQTSQPIASGDELEEPHREEAVGQEGEAVAGEEGAVDEEQLEDEEIVEEEEVPVISYISILDAPRELPEPENLTAVHLKKISEELGLIKLCWPELDDYTFEDRNNFPKSYLGNNSKERLLLLYTENFRKQFCFKYPNRKPLFLASDNECGIQKMVCTAIRPTTLPYTEIETWQECAKFIGDHLEYEALENPTLIPHRLYSPHTTILRQSGQSFELATALCSLLIGFGYDAYVVSGYACKDIALRIMCRVDSPYPPQSEEKENAEEAPPSSKYVLRPIRDLRSKFVLMMEQREIDKAKREELEFREMERKKQLEDEKPPPDELDGQRVHAWVLLLAGERDVENSVFVEPSTGIVYPLDSPLYLGIESVWNHQNYWVNMQECTEGPGCLKYDLTDVKNWEHLLIGEPIKWRRRKTDESEMEEDSNLEMYDEKHLDIPMSWSMKISIPHDVLKSRFPNGMKRTKYKRTLVEEYAPYVQYDGMVLRIVRYSDFDCTEEQSVEERFENRRDKLMKVMNDIQTGMATEYFDGGREDGVRKHVYYRDNTPDSDKDRIIEFNHQARYDALSKLEISPEDTSEHYLGTDHSLYYRYILYAERKPSGYGIRRNIVRIMEKFNRNEEKPVSEDIAWREFAIADREISLKFHYGKGKVTASTREYSKPPLAEMGEGMKFYPELTSGYQAEIGRKPPRQLELFFLLEDQLKEEEKSINHVRNNETMIADFLLQRDREMAFPKLDVSLFNIEQNVEFRKGMLERENEKILQKEREVDEEIDYLKPYFARLGSPAELKYNDAVQLRDSCLKEFRELMLNRATKIQRQFEVTSEDLGRRQQWYIINHEDLSADEEAQYFEEVNQIIFLLHIYEIRLLRHRGLSSFRYAALVNYLKHHPLLEKLL